MPTEFSCCYWSVHEMSFVVMSGAFLYKQGLWLTAPDHFLVCWQLMMVCSVGWMTRSRTLPNNSKDFTVIYVLQALQDNEFETKLVGGSHALTWRTSEIAYNQTNRLCAVCPLEHKQSLIKCWSVRVAFFRFRWKVFTYRVAKCEV